MIPPAALTTDSVRYWSDYSRVYYHPRSSVQINEYELNSGIQPFEGYGLGQELFRDLNREHDLIDRDFRLFAEECDQMQGIQLLTSTDDAWAGFAGEYLAELRDEYGKVGICTWGLERSDRVVRVRPVVPCPHLLAHLPPFLLHSSLCCCCQNIRIELPRHPGHPLG